MDIILHAAMHPTAVKRRKLKSRRKSVFYPTFGLSDVNYSILILLQVAAIGDLFYWTSCTLVVCSVPKLLM
jgi:hypothetical protein